MACDREKVRSEEHLGQKNLTAENRCNRQEGLDAWHAIVRRFDQRNNSDKKISRCSTDLQHLREVQSKIRGAV